MAYVEGRTADGTSIRIDQDPMLNRDEPILFDGDPVPLVAPPTGPRRSMSRLRDGGTTTIHTARGVIVAHRRMGTEPWDEFDGERLLT